MGRLTVSKNLRKNLLNDYLTTEFIELRPQWLHMTKNTTLQNRLGKVIKEATTNNNNNTGKNLTFKLMHYITCLVFSKKSRNMQINKCVAHTLGEKSNQLKLFLRKLRCWTKQTNISY